MEEILRSVLGGGQQGQFTDFISRYLQGRPADGYSNQEVADRYQQVATRLPAEAYEQSAAEAFARMSPEERQAFSEWLRQRAQQQGMSAPDLDGDGRPDYAQDPQALARMTTRVQQQHPDLLGQLLGGQSGTALDNPFVKAAAAGIAAYAAQRLLGGR